MTEVKAVKCDSCKTIVLKEESVARKTTYKGTDDLAGLSGSHSEDLCGKCAHDAVSAVGKDAWEPAKKPKRAEGEGTGPSETT